MIFKMIILTILMITQIVLFIIFFHYGKNISLMYTSYLCWVLSAVFAWLPIYELKKEGKVPKGKSYVYTTVLVDSGVYRLVWHPQYLAGIILSLAFIFISQHWSVFILGLLVIGFLYRDMIDADQSSVEKFGDDYIYYMRRVPRMNFLYGLARLIRQKNYRNEKSKKTRVLLDK